MLTRYAKGSLTWIDVVSPTPAEIRDLMDEWGLHPVIAQELLAPSPKSKVERYEESVFVVLHFPALRGTQRREQEIDFIIGKHFLITARYDEIDPLQIFAKAFEVDAVLGRHSHLHHGGHLFATMARNLYRALLAECDTIEGRLRDIEERIFQGDERGMVIELSQVGRAVHDFRQALIPHQEMLRSLELPSERLFGHEFAYHTRSVMGEYERLRHTLEHLRDALEELRETNNSLLSTKQNEIMKILTIMAFVTFPLSLIASIFGMNTEYLPVVGLPGDFWIVIGTMGALTLSFFIFFKYKKWL